MHTVGVSLCTNFWRRARVCLALSVLERPRKEFTRLALVAVTVWHQAETSGGDGDWATPYLPHLRASDAGRRTPPSLPHVPSRAQGSGFLVPTTYLR
jgi:hypothetical protein